MSQSDAWSAAALRIIRQSAGDLELDSELASLGSLNESGTVWIFESALSVDSPLEWHLGEISTLISQHVGALERLSEGHIVELFLGWTPAPGEKLQLSSKLVGLLARIRAGVVFDVYVDDE